MFIEPKNYNDVLIELARDEGHRIVKVYREVSSPPEPGPLLEEVDVAREVKLSLNRLGIERLYKFQAEAIKLVRGGENTVIVAGTGTGKTEAFLIPVLNDIVEEPFSGVRALLIYPTKALARDQLARLNKIIDCLFGVRAMVLDGDTSEKDRQSIYDMPPQILITNPDMIHFSLMFSDDFKQLLSNLKYIVLDDMHVYTGVFGTHVYYVLRRLKRFLSSDAVFVGATATISNPREFAEALWGEEAHVVNAGTGRLGDLWHVMLSPKSRSRIAETISLLDFCVRKGLKTLVFADSHRYAEIIKRVASRRGINVGIHRAGLLPQERRKIEVSFKEGSLDAVVATPTLELGIDIGDLDSVILSTIPPTYSKLIQRTGRCGRRRGRAAYAFIILGNDPISQYYENYPADFFSRSLEPASIEPSNEEIAALQVIAMTLDRPVRLEELNEVERRITLRLLNEGYLRKSGGLLKSTRKGLAYLRRRAGLRGVGEVVRIYDWRRRVIGYREMPMAIKELYPGAIYLHGGDIYIVIKLEKLKAVVRRLPNDFGYVTSPLYYSEPTFFKPLEGREVYGIPVEYGELKVREVVYGYTVKDFDSGAVVRETLLSEDLDYMFTTKGVLLKFPINPNWDLKGNAEAFHALEHIIISASQTLLGASPTDMGGVSFPSGHIFIYDSFPAVSYTHLTLPTICSV